MTKSEPERVLLSGDLNIFLLTGEQTAGAFAQWEAHVPPGGGPPLHVHSREDESFYVVEGEIFCTLGQQSFPARAGDSVYLPRGIAHRFRNETGQLARVLITVQPAGLEHMFLAAGTRVIPGAEAQVVDRSAERERLLASAKQYGIEYLLNETAKRQA